MLRALLIKLIGESPMTPLPNQEYEEAARLAAEREARVDALELQVRAMEFREWRRRNGSDANRKPA